MAVDAALRGAVRGVLAGSAVTLIGFNTAGPAGSGGEELTTYVIFAVLILLGIAAGTILFVAQMCTHELVSEVDPVTGKTLQSCRCGERFRL